jgi:hypothetical protein
LIPHDAVQVEFSTLLNEDEALIKKAVRPEEWDKIKE